MFIQMQESDARQLGVRLMPIGRQEILDVSDDLIALAKQLD